MRPRFGMGRVHDGFHAALFYSDTESGSLYTQIIECLVQVDSTKNLPIFLSGMTIHDSPHTSYPACSQAMSDSAIALIANECP